MKAFVLTLILVLAPAILAQSRDSHGTTTYADGSQNMNEKCKKLDCPDSTVIWQCECSQCKLECGTPIINDDFPEGLSAEEKHECQLSGGRDFYLDGKYLMCSSTLPEHSEDERGHI